MDSDDIEVGYFKFVLERFSGYQVLLWCVVSIFVREDLIFVKVFLRLVIWGFLCSGGVCIDFVVDFWNLNLLIVYSL